MDDAHARRGEPLAIPVVQSRRHPDAQLPRDLELWALRLVRGLPVLPLALRRAVGHRLAAAALFQPRRWRPLLPPCPAVGTLICRGGHGGRLPGAVSPRSGRPGGGRGHGEHALHEHRLHALDRPRHVDGLPHLQGVLGQRGGGRRPVTRVPNHLEQAVLVRNLESLRGHDRQQVAQPGHGLLPHVCGPPRRAALNQRGERPLLPHRLGLLCGQVVANTGVGQAVDHSEGAPPIVPADGPHGAPVLQERHQGGAPCPPRAGRAAARGSAPIGRPQSG
mmetsp:Transcript_26618/g.68363  ORF Transcript_26618/g.68363 Transcript_26618/m.68363 type:complete len:277 (-) Transcript_26618:105-935(-)